MAPWGGSSMVAGMAATPHEAHQVGRHMDRPHAGMSVLHDFMGVSERWPAPAFLVGQS
jgi:hypothetical protein